MKTGKVYRCGTKTIYERNTMFRFGENMFPQEISSLFKSNVLFHARKFMQV